MSPLCQAVLVAKRLYLVCVCVCVWTEVDLSNGAAGALGRWKTLISMVVVEALGGGKRCSRLCRQTQANSNLVIVPPESDSQVTQVAIGGVGKWPSGPLRPQLSAQAP